MKNTNIALVTLLMGILVSCASTPQMIIDPASVADADQLPIDQAECTSIAQQYDLTGEIAAKSLGGGALGAARPARARAVRRLQVGAARPAAGRRAGRDAVEGDQAEEEEGQERRRGALRLISVR